MPSAEFSRTLDVASPPEACWSVLTDVERMATWVTVAHDVSEVEHLRAYRVVLQDQFGPFKLNAVVEVDVTDVDPERSIHFKGSGQDRHVGTTISVEARMDLTETGTGSKMKVEGTYHVLGAVAAMGSSTIRKKADTIMEEFFSAAVRELS